MKVKHLCLSALLCLAPGAARSQPAPLEPLPPQAERREPVALGRHAPSAHIVELTMGFIAGQRQYLGAPFESKNGVAVALTEPFSRAPYDGTTVFGLRYDLRATVSFIRMTIGLDLPFSTFSSASTTTTYQVDGQGRQVTVQALRPYELRFGLGGELPVSIFAPFVDLLGAAHFVDTGLAIDSEKAEYRAAQFGFSLRAGTRLHVRRWFFAQLAGEAGLYGPVRWNAELSVGFAAGKWSRL